MSTIIWKINPELLHVWVLRVRWYGLFFACAFIAGHIIFGKMLKHEKKDEEIMDPLLITMIISTLIGARLGHCLFYNADYYLSQPIEILKVWKGGLASHGSAIGILTGIFIFTRINKQYTFLELLDRLVIPIALAGFFIRTGNFFNHELVGTPTDVPWAVRFTHSIEDPILFRHPVQLYEAFSYLAIFGLLLACYIKKTAGRSPGLSLGIFFTSVFTARFILEFFKNRQAEFLTEFPLRMGQLLSLPLILIGIILITISLRRIPRRK